jgi:hypothetical protein
MGVWLQDRQATAQMTSFTRSRVPENTESNLCRSAPVTLQLNGGA